MSFLMQSQRGYEHVSRQNLSDLSDQNQPNKIQMPPSSFDDYPDQPFPPHSSPQLQNTDQLAFVDHSQPNLPKVGETRCYWALLSSDLHFIYTDPVLTSHLGEQANGLIGKSLLVFVHPDEQASAKHDLGSVLESRTLHGSVTRVRFSRLLKVRRELGYQGTGPLWMDAEKVLADSNYMAVDIVINWAAEGLVLCFIHAVVDLTPADNDELNKTGWTNWCGTTGMGMEQVQLLYRRLLMCIPQSGTMTRVFQILSNQPGRPLLLSWPPDNDQGQGPTGRDFAKLVEDVQIGTSVRNGNDAKTSCTRRYKALQNMSAVMGEVESVFIPHGTVIFACHKFNSPSRPTAEAPSAMQQLAYGQNPESSHQQYYEHGSTYALPPSSASYNHYLSQPSQQVAQYSPSHWSQGGEPSISQQQYHSWNSPSPAHSTSPLPQAVSNLRSGSYPSPQQAQHWPSQSSSYMESESATPQGSPTYSYSATESAESTSPGTPNDPVPPPRRRVSPGTTRDQYTPGGRGAGNRPIGVLKCSSCKATQSPEWRKGPSGKKELCNACGLRYARSRAKKEGHTLTSQRRRKDKGAAAAKRESATPPVSASQSYGSLRRGGYDNSFSTGSNSGSEVYSQSSHHALDTLTPSPSPPASSVNFVHYSPQSQNQPGDGRQPYNNSTGSFYSVPSPLSNPPVIHNTSMDHMSYSDRLSPMLSSASPISHSPLTSTTAPASFEREREKDRELPPTPISAEPKQQSRRSMLTHERR